MATQIPISTTQSCWAKGGCPKICLTLFLPRGATLPPARYGRRPPTPLPPVPQARRGPPIGQIGRSSTGAGLSAPSLAWRRRIRPAPTASAPSGRSRCSIHRRPEAPRPHCHTPCPAATVILLQPTPCRPPHRSSSTRQEAHTGLGAPRLSSSSDHD